MKYLVLLVVVAVVLLLIGGRRRARGDRAPGTGGDGRNPAPPPAPRARTMLACAHCGVHLPDDETTRDPAGRAYCSDAHRVAGPR